MNQERLMKIILRPHVSEKASIGMAERSLYVFKVLSDADKLDVKDATEFLFGVKVKSVRMMNVKSKPKRFGKIEGKSKTWKKAYVTLQDGQKIDFGLI